MRQGQQQFIEGFMAAARLLGVSAVEQSDATRLPHEQEELFRETRLSLDDYLAIPTFIRRGRVNRVAAIKPAA